MFDVVTGVASDLTFPNKQEILSRINQVHVTKMRTAARLFAGQTIITLPYGTKECTAAFKAPLDDDVPADPNAGTPYEGTGSVTNLRCALTGSQQLEFQSSLHPRECAIMTMGLVRQLDFDTVRNAAVSIHFGDALVGTTFLDMRYEPFRELYVMPPTQGPVQFYADNTLLMTLTTPQLQTILRIIIMLSTLAPEHPGRKALRQHSFIVPP